MYSISGLVTDIDELPNVYGYPNKSPSFRMMPTLMRLSFQPLTLTLTMRQTAQNF